MNFDEKYSLDLFLKNISENLRHVILSHYKTRKQINLLYA